MTAVDTPNTAPLFLAADVALTGMWLGRTRCAGGYAFVAREAPEAAMDLVRAAALPGRTAGEHVHLANAYSIATADEAPAVRATFDDPRGWLLPDGRPLVWLSAARRDDPRLRQVRGPQLMLDVADLGRAAGLRHYLLGGSTEVLAALEANLRERFPGIEIVGACSPPFRPCSDDELAERDLAIRASGAQIVWVGLGTPKQDLEAARIAASLPVVAVAIGAAFDYAAGALKQAPRWISLAGMEWMWRFAAEPRRLWKRYTIGNARFIRAVVRSEVRARRPVDAVDPTASSTVVVGQLPPPLHGSAVMTEQLIGALRANGDSVIVVDRRFSRSAEEVGRPAVRKVLAIPSLVRRYRHAMRRADRLVLLITTTPASFLIDQLLLTLTRRPVVLYIHTIGFTALAERGAVWRHLVERGLRRAACVVVLGPSLIDDVLPFLEPQKISVVPNAIAAGALPRHHAGHRVLFLSNLLPGKGADVFVRLSHDLVRRRPDLPWAFDLAGAGDTSVLGPVPAELTLHGVVGGPAKSRLLGGADVLVVPSTYTLEAQPLVIVEALAHGVPIVAYDNGGIRDLVDDSVGALVPIGDEASLADAVLELMGSPERRLAARAAARQRYEREHSPAVYGLRWRQVVAGLRRRP